MKTTKGDATLCIHAGEERHGKKTSLTTDTAQTSVFIIPSIAELRKINAGKSDAYMYTRYANPTVRAAEEKIAALEGAEDCVVTSSGQAATLCTVLAICKAGDEIVSMLDIYGGTSKLFRNVLTGLDLKTNFVPFNELSQIERHFNRKTKVLFLESPTNPTLRCADIVRLAQVGKRRGAQVIVDNTFATPILQKPLQLGADVSLHSATKYLGGHSDLSAGAVCGSKLLMTPVRELRKHTGGVLDPGAAYLLIRGLKTLEIRVERACQNAAKIAAALQKNKNVSYVFYPGERKNESYGIAHRQMKSAGMMIAINVKGGGRAAERLIDRLKLWYLAASLGGVESTVSYPVLTSHAGMSQPELKLLGVSAATVRLSVGIEDADDLIADLQQALA